jgi:hypothetical protein
MSDMARAYDLAAAAVRQRYAEQHPRDLETLDALVKSDVAVFTGVHDSVQEVLRRLNIPFVADPKMQGLKARIVFANCTGTANPDLVQHIAAHVKEGAWFVSSDWCLRSVVQTAFPNTVRWNHKSSADEVVAVEPARESLWSEVVVLGADPQWWLEGGSYPIEVLDAEKVSIETASHELLVRYKAPVVAVRFAWGQGQVYHVISHLWLKRTRTPQGRYQGPGTDFLKAGMRLTDDGIAQVLRETRTRAEDFNFATVQSAATSTELVAQLCVRALQSSHN